VLLRAVIFGGLAEGASPGPDTFPGLHPNALQAASRQLFAQAKSVQGANQTSPKSWTWVPDSLVERLSGGTPYLC